MLTDPALRNLKPKSKIYKVFDRDGMYVTVSPVAKEAGLPLDSFTVHDLRRTASTLLNEVGFNGDWIEKCLAHEEGSRSSRSVYNKAEYAGPRRHMLQEWADMVEAWIDGRTHVSKLVPEDVTVPVLSPAV